jgi:hypothetical protein
MLLHSVDVYFIPMYMQPKDQSAPGYLPLEKLEQMLADMAVSAQ